MTHNKSVTAPAKHTPERWWRHDVFADPGTAQIWTDESHGSVMIAITAGADREANAARIVACVNACAGLNPDALPALIAAAEHALVEFDRCTMFDANGSAFDALRSALSALRGDK